MIKRIQMISLILLFMSFSTACGQNEDESYSQFKEEIDSFCVSISTIDSQINNIDTSSADYIDELLSSLDSLDDEFEKFSSLDFPDEYNYLEATADEASAYMKEAVKSFHEAFTNEKYNEETFTAQYKYARENYSRAYKRIQIIITFLHGEEPTGAILQ